MACRASVDPPASPGQLVVTGWNFRSLDGTISIDRANAEGGLGTDSTMWAGVMVVSGTVTVHATIEGRSATAASTVTIRSREWTNKAIPMYPDPVNVGQGDHDSNPGSVHDLGKTRHEWDPIFQFAFAKNAVGTESTGPNIGLSYVLAVPPFVRSIIVAINNDALTAHSAFWKGQPETLSGTITPGSTPCTRSAVTSHATRDKILAHEGLAFDVNSHTRLFRDAALRPAGPAIEGIVTVFTRVTDESAKADQLGAVQFGCTFNFTYPRNP